MMFARAEGLFEIPLTPTQTRRLFFDHQARSVQISRRRSPRSLFGGCLSLCYFFSPPFVSRRPSHARPPCKRTHTYTNHVLVRLPTSHPSQQPHSCVHNHTHVPYAYADTHPVRLTRTRTFPRGEFSRNFPERPGRAAAARRRRCSTLSWP